MAVLAAVGSPVFPGYGMILSLVNGNHISARLSVILYNRTTSLSAVVECLNVPLPWCVGKETQ